MDLNAMRDAVSQFEVIMKLLIDAEDELNMNSGDIRRAKGYLIAAQGVANSQIEILKDTLDIIGS